MKIGLVKREEIDKIKEIDRSEIVDFIRHPLAIEDLNYFHN